MCLCAREEVGEWVRECVEVMNGATGNWKNCSRDGWSLNTVSVCLRDDGIIMCKPTWLTTLKSRFDSWASLDFPEQSFPPPSLHLSLFTQQLINTVNR